MSARIAKNTILFGPPGTGKTYHTVIYAVAIIENKTAAEVVCEAEESGYAAVKKRFDDYKSKGRISFVTFHQSYGYEDFIEGIRPVLRREELNDGTDDTVSEISYQIHDGIFKQFCENARLAQDSAQGDNYGLNQNPAVWKVSLEGTGDNETRRECLEKGHIRIGWDNYGPLINEATVFDRSKGGQGGKQILDAFINKMRIGDLVLSCYSAAETDAIGVITGDYEWNGNYPDFNRVRKVKWLVKGIRENILRINGDASMTLSTVYKMRIPPSEVMEIVRKYSSPQETRPSGNYVFIIDEINRGNISKIFGELITLIEPAKRLGEKEEIRVKLPCSGYEFGVPGNVYILGTMNTADRSIALIDTALRRRFSFREMMPDCDLLNDVVISDGEKTLNAAEMLRVINQRISCLYDREHAIGHAFFMPLREDPRLEVLAEIFQDRIIPLLQEYFYDDCRKIQLILGDNGKDNPRHKFILDAPAVSASLFRGAAGLQADDLPEDIPEATYRVNPDPEVFLRLASYIGIMRPEN